MFVELMFCIELIEVYKLGVGKGIFKVLVKMGILML